MYHVNDMLNKTHKIDSSGSIAQKRDQTHPKCSMMLAFRNVNLHLDALISILHLHVIQSTYRWGGWKYPRHTNNIEATTIQKFAMTKNMFQIICVWPRRGLWSQYNNNNNLKRGLTDTQMHSYTHDKKIHTWACKQTHTHTVPHGMVIRAQVATSRVWV